MFGFRKQRPAPAAAPTRPAPTAGGRMTLSLDAATADAMEQAAERRAAVGGQRMVIELDDETAGVMTYVRDVAAEAGVAPTTALAVLAAAGSVARANG